MVAKTGWPTCVRAATRQRARNQLSRGSLTTSSVWPSSSRKCPSSQSAVRIRPFSRAQTFPVPEPRLRPRVADLDGAVLEQPVVVLDDPLRLTETLRVGLVRDHLGLRTVEFDDLHQAGHRVLVPLRPRGHEQHLARVVLGLEVARRATASGVGGGAAHGWEAYPVRLEPLDRFAS